MISGLPIQANSDDNEIYDIAIIGAGPTGLFAGYYAGMRQMKTVIIDALPEAGGQVTALYPEKYIYDVPGFTAIQGRELVQRLTDQALQFGADMQLGERVLDLHSYGDQPIVLTSNQRQYRARSVLISAGVGAFAPNRLPACGAERFEGRGVYYAVKEKAAFAGRNVMIVGGGDSAVDWALGLEDIAASVTLVHRRDQFRAHERSVEALYKSSVQLKLCYELSELHGETQIEAATILDNRTQLCETLPIDTVIALLGFKADAGPIRNWGLTFGKGRAIQIGQNCETSLPGVYAAGSIADSPVKLDLIALHFGQAALAVNSAKAYIDPQAELSPGHSSEMSHLGQPAAMAIAS
jgi:thioredoxin reductase (NADPH)